MHVLLHICCGPCSIYPIAKLKEEGHQLHGFFYNPNIHPYQEYNRRLETLKTYADNLQLPLLIRDDYNFEDFIRQVVYREGERCIFCYAMRLRETARFAKKGKFDAFSTSLLVSPFQKHDIIKTVGEEIAKEYEIPFIYRDFRPGYKSATATSKELSMYRQQYCGCIYSEKERYYKPSKGEK